MGSKEESIVPYSADYSRSPSRSRLRRSPSRSRSRRNGARSKEVVAVSEKSEKLEPIGVRAAAATSRLSQLKLTKEHDARRVELARKAVEKAQQALEEAIAADLASTAKLQQAEQESSKVLQEERIQKLVDERYEAKRSRQYDKADKLESTLRDMGVQVSGPHLSWQGPGGLSGKVGVPMRAGEWECTKCDIAVPPRAAKCNKCGSYKPGSSGNDRDDRRERDRSRGRDRDQRRGDGRNRRDGGRSRRRRSDSSS